MRRCRPQDAGYEPAFALPPLGQALRSACVDGTELWRLSTAFRKQGERLLAGGRCGIGGFLAGGEDSGGVWLARRVGGPCLDDAISTAEPLPVSDATRLVLQLARILEHAEALDVTCPLVLAELALRNETLTWRAEGWVHQLVGGDGVATCPTDVRFVPPEQAAGHPWDAGANRYVIGLLAYRLWAGEHAFASKGLRLGLEAQHKQLPPPFSRERNSQLPFGAQSFCLRLLDPDPRVRPQSARRLRKDLESVLGLREPKPRAGPGKPVPEPKGDRPQPPPEGPKKPALTRRPLAVVLGLALGLLGLKEVIPSTSVAGPERPSLSRRGFERPDLVAQDCESCHPRQASEWRRSVMAHSAKSPLFQALEMLIEEQVGRDRECPGGAGVLRHAGSAGACRDSDSLRLVTGSGGERWCVNCHAAGFNLKQDLPAWDGQSSNSPSRRPLKDLLSEVAMDGIGCAFCHQVQGPAAPGALERGGYEGNPFWTSTSTGERFSTRPENGLGIFGIANSGYSLEPKLFLAAGPARGGRVHQTPSAPARAYLRSSEFCGSCHDVRLFGTDVLGRRRGEHFKRLRNAYSEWAIWARQRVARGRPVFSCQDCHMSLFPGTCGPQAAGSAVFGCPPGTGLVEAEPGRYPEGFLAVNSQRQQRVSPHYFSGVDVPLSDEFTAGLISDSTLDRFGIPLGARQRRALLLASSVRLELTAPRVDAGRLRLGVVVENVGAGHRVPAGFSQERELWVHLRVTDADDRLVYEVGRVDRPDQDLKDKIFTFVNTRDDSRDALGRPLGVFGADVLDGPDLPRWQALPVKAAGPFERQRFLGRGLINFQNGFLRCVACIGRIDDQGTCQPLAGQQGARAQRYVDADYDPDTGECRSNLSGRNALFETYYPVGALDSTRGIVKGPDAIIDTRSLPPEVPREYTYDLPLRGRAPYRATARLLFRPFPPFLLRAFVDYERRQAERGLRPSGPLIDERALERLSLVELSAVRVVGTSGDAG